MHHGDFITLLPHKIRVSEQELAPLGITNRSLCWARWVPDRRSERADPVSHLIVSPFDIASWPALFRITLSLDDTRFGTLACALQVLREMDFNVLAVEGTPAGHRHAAVNIIGEASAIRKDQKLLQIAEQLQDNQRTFLNDETQAYVHTKLAPRMLKFSAEVTRRLLNADAHGKHSFLRRTYVNTGKPNPKRGTLYDPASLPRAVRRIALQQSTPAASCSWLHSHAFFWLYGLGAPEERLLRFDASKRSLSPEGKLEREYEEAIGELSPPFKAIASLDYSEQYMRIVLSDLDRPRRTFRVEVNYSDRYDDRHNTKGLLERLTTTLADKHVALRSVDMTTEARDKTSENGRFIFLASVLASRMSSADLVEFVTTAAAEGMNTAKAELRQAGCKIDSPVPSVTAFSARWLFLSTNFEWLHNKKRGLFEKIRLLAADLGFQLILGDPSYLGRDHEHRWDDQATITANVLSLLRSCDAFLQVIPEAAMTSKDDGDKLIWLLFESGAAHSVGMPCAICVDTAGKVDIAEWRKRLKAGTEKKVFDFCGDGSDESILEAITKSLESLARQSAQIKRSRYWAK